MATQLQRIGETIFATLLLLSFVQACVALYQYRYDVRGQLVFPEGLTFGREDYYQDVTADVGAGSSSSTTASSAERRDANNVVDADNTYEEEKAYELLDISTEDTPSLTTTTTTSSTTSWVTKLIKRLNKSLVVLLPWITRNIHSLLTRNTHLFHIGFMVFILDSLLPLLDGDDDDKLHHAHGEKQKKHHHAPSSIKSISSSLVKKISNEEEPINVLVLGDSLAIGIGCVEKFDVTKDNSVPFALIEQRESSHGQKQQQCQGPVFPQVLARTLSYHTHHPVQWRSAGVDGGSISEIKSFCMDVVKQEANAIDGSSTDIVVVLFGMNDLKKLLSVYVNPIQSLISGGSDTDRMSEGKGIKEFRRGMELFIDEIHTHAPEAVVVFPTLPIQPFHKNSIINIFPLGMMVDAVLGLWERQKRIVANKSTNALYIELTADEIADWYSPGSSTSNNDDMVVNGEDDEYRVSDDFDMDVLLSADGVHPNTNMYAQWAGLVGKKLYENIIVSLSQEEKQKTKQMV